MSTIFQNQSIGDFHACYCVFHDDFESNSTLVLLLVVLVLTMIFIITPNVLLIHGLRSTTRDFKSLSLTKKLFMYLSCTDLFTGLVSVPVQIWMLVISKDATCLQVAIQAFTNAFTPALAMFTLLSISIHRFLSVAKARFYREHVHSKIVIFVLVLQALAALGLTAWYVISTQTRTYDLLGCFLIFVTFLCFGTVGTAVIVNLSLLIYLKRLNHQSMIIRGCQTNAKYQAEVAKTLLVISLVLVLCYLSNGIVFSIVGYHVLKGDTHADSYNDVIPWAHVPMLLNAGMNSLIYMWRDTKISTYYKNIFCNKDRNSDKSALVDYNDRNQRGDAFIILHKDEEETLPC